ncbi:SlyX family protein, partial [Desulfovibrio piger]
MDQEERIIRLEELAYFQEERLRELNEALTAQQQQIDTLEHRL